MGHFLGENLDIRSNLLLRWRFDETSGDALDSSVNSFNGTVTGVTQGVAGHLGLAYSFDGTDNNVTNTAVGLTTPLEGITAFTICFWAKTGAFALNDCAAGFGLDGADDAICLYPFNTSGGNGFAVWYDGEFIFTASGSAPANDTYSHFCYRQNGATTHEIFINGISVGTDATSKTSPAVVDGVSVGNYTGNGEFFDGEIDDVRLYTRSLTDEQILFLGSM